MKLTNSKCLEKKNRLLLLTAASYGYSKTMQYLVRRGADPNAQDQDGLSPLMWVIVRASSTLAEGNEESIKSDVVFLLEHGADPNLKDNDGENLLQFAIDYGLNEIANLLIKAGAAEEWRPS